MAQPMNATLQLPQVLGELADFNLQRFGEYTALYYEGQVFTNIRLVDEARRLAAGLLALGVRAGDRVLVMMVNSPEVIVAYQAIARMGGVIVPLLPVLKLPEVQHIAANCRPSAFITSAPLVPLVQPALDTAGLGGTCRIIVAGDRVEGSTNYADIIATSDPLIKPPTVTPDDLAIILYTSGTTGQPKGVMLSHRNQMFNITCDKDEAFLLGRAPRPPEPILIALPLAHAFGLTVSNSMCLTGDPMILLPRFDSQKVCASIEKYQVVKMVAVPAMLAAMLAYPDAARYDTSSLTLVASGSAPLPESLLRIFEQRYGAQIREGYGLSEATTVVSNHRDDMPTKIGSVGKPLPGVEVQIFDAENRSLPAGERGEVMVRGANVMVGYYQNPDATRTVIDGEWLHTGDIGYLDDDGYLYIVERKKDMIIRAGQNVYPRDVEEILANHPDVQEVAVVGVPSDRYGEEVKAFVALRSGHDASAEDLIRYCQQFLANYKTPAYIEFIPALPRNGVGKINKRALREKSNI